MGTKIRFSLIVLLVGMLIAISAGGQPAEAQVAAKEQVKCIFSNSEATQQCYAENNQFECTGIGTCIADISGEQGKKLMWKSSCGGYAYTIIDGNNEYAEFVCEQTPEQNPSVKEQVKCVFANSGESQKCYSDDGKFGCSGTGTCIADVSGEKGNKLVWKSSCGGYAYTVLDGEYEYAEFECVEALPASPTPIPIPSESKPTGTASIIKEQVKCVFANSETVQKCYADDSQIGCSGIGTCVVDVSGEKGKKLVWKSSCSGYDSTVIDGDNDYAEFKCEGEKGKSPMVKEQVKCVFANSNAAQQCYAAESESGCSGVGACVTDIFGEKGTKVVWKSSCGGYAYTIIDGDVEYVEFKCAGEADVTAEAISGKGFRFAYWECYDGTAQKQGDGKVCKSSDVWQKYAAEFCQDKCYPDKSKCGVNSYSVSEECYLDYNEEGVVFVSSVEAEEKKQELKGNEEKQQLVICKDSCPRDGKCYPFGYRADEKFCSDEGSFVSQMKGDAKCENSFECSSNVCIDGKCVSSGFLEKIMSWLKQFFG